MMQSNSFEAVYKEIKIIILKNIEIFKIPNDFDSVVDNNFTNSLKDKLDNYNDFLKKNINEIINKNIKFDSKDDNVILNKVTSLNRGIIDTINIYLNGKPFEANSLFIKTLSDISFKEVQFEYSIKKEKLFYRARCVKEGLLAKEELFHIPFQIRHLVSTNRYSIPGVPALYFGENTYTSWEEFERPDFKKMVFSIFENTKEINTIQILRIEDLFEEIETNDIDDNFKFIFILRFLIYFPLSLACSIKSKNKGSFKIEYIIPQMLLEYVIQNEKIDGIKFPSTKVNYQNLEKLKAYNYVFPIKKSKTSGFCSKLTETFILSEPTSLEMEELLDNPYIKGTFLYSRKELQEEPEKLTIIKNDKRQYYKTSFGKLDKILEKKERKAL